MLLCSFICQRERLQGQFFIITLMTTLLSESNVHLGLVTRLEGCIKDAAYLLLLQSAQLYWFVVESFHIFSMYLNWHAFWRIWQFGASARYSYLLCTVPFRYQFLKHTQTFAPFRTIFLLKYFEQFLFSQHKSPKVLHKLKCLLLTLFRKKIYETKSLIKQLDFN